MQCQLFNVVPTQKRKRESQQRLWAGKAVFEELMLPEMGQWTPTYQLKFEYESTPHVFCRTRIMRRLRDVKRVLQRQPDGAFHVLARAQALDIVLELRIGDAAEEQKFQDMWQRMLEEFEMLAEK